MFSYSLDHIIPNKFRTSVSVYMYFQCGNLELISNLVLSSKPPKVVVH